MDDAFTTETWVHCMILCASHLPPAQECLATLLSNNEELLDKFVDDETVKSFIRNIQEKGPESATMEFFTAICSCKGKQILSNQELCLKRLLRDKKKRVELMIETTSFSVEMFDYVKNNRKENVEYVDFLKKIRSIDLEDIFLRAATKKAEGNQDGVLQKEKLLQMRLESDGLREAFKEFHVVLNNKDIAFLMERADLDHMFDDNEDTHHDGNKGKTVNFLGFKRFVLRHLHPEWELEFERTRQYTLLHDDQGLGLGSNPNSKPKGLKKKTWEFSTEALATTKDPEKFKSLLKNQYFHYEKGSKTGTENPSFSQPMRYLGDQNLCESSGWKLLTDGSTVEYKENGRLRSAVIESMKRDKSNKQVCNIKFLGSKQEEKKSNVPIDQLVKRVIKFDPVFIAWTGNYDWMPRRSELFFSPSRLGIVDDNGIPYIPRKNKGQLDGSEKRAWVPIERICWILDPEKLFLPVMFPKLDDAERDEVKNYCINAMISESDNKHGTVGQEQSAGGNNDDAIAKKYDNIFTVEGMLTDECKREVEDRIKEVSKQGDAGDEIPSDALIEEHTKLSIWWYKKCVRESLIATGKLSDNSQADNEEQKAYQDLIRIAKYYADQIFLFSEMCLDRSYNSIYEMMRQFPYDTLISLMGNELLPDRIRSGFTLLLLRVYIDRYPHAPIQAPGAVQVFEDQYNIAGDMAIKERECLDGDNLKEDRGNQADGTIGILPQFLIPRDGPLSKGRVGSGANMNLSSMMFLMFGIGNNEAPGDKFYLVEEFITSFLLQLEGRQDPNNEERNRFVLSILKVVQDLVRFGFYGTYYELMDVTTPLVQMLNGSMDTTEGDAKRYSSKQKGNKLVTDSKIAIIRTLMDLNRVRDDYRQKILMGYFKDSYNSAYNSADRAGVPGINKESLLFPKLLADKFENERKYDASEKSENEGAESYLHKIAAVGMPKFLLNVAHRASPSSSQLEELIRNEQKYLSDHVELKKVFKEVQIANKTAMLSGIDELEADEGKTQLLEKGKQRESTTKEWHEAQNNTVYTLSSYCQHRINDIFESIVDDHGASDKDNDLNTHDYGLLDLDTMSPSENLNAVCMDLMMYEDPALFECAFSLLWSQFAQRQPVVDALQNVMLLNEPEIYHHDCPLIVQWKTNLSEVDDVAWNVPWNTERCTLVHVKHLKSFRQLLRRGVEAYELWGKREILTTEDYHTDTVDSNAEAYSMKEKEVMQEEEQKKEQMMVQEARKKEDWYFQIMGYLVRTDASRLYRY